MNPSDALFIDSLRFNYTLALTVGKTKQLAKLACLWVNLTRFQTSFLSWQLEMYRLPGCHLVWKDDIPASFSNAMNWDWIVSACLGVGLAACCGFRVFVPMLVAGLATKLHIIGTMSGFEWISSWPALMLLGVATIVELGAYYVPWLDNALDTIAGPAAIVAGTVLSTSFLQIDSPVIDWGMGLMLGGGSAGLIQAGTSLLRLGSTATTGGLGNPVVSTAENAASFGFSILAVLLPLVCIVIIGIILIYVASQLARRGRTTFTRPAK